MPVEYLPPLVRSWNRMRRALFEAPVDAGKWFAVGFAAWLAGLAEGGGGGTFWNTRGRGEGLLRAAPGHARDLLESAVWIWVAVFVLLFVLALVVLILWLSSRAKFVFLHDVLHDLKAIRDPWRAWAREGNSLFLWRLGFAIVVFAAVLFAVLPFILLAVGVERAGSGLLGGFLIAMTILFGLVVVVVAGYVSLFLDSFVVPIMYRDRLRATEAWRRFVPLLRREPAEFLLYGIFVLLLAVGLAIAVFVAGCATCCVGLVLIAIPYLGSVVLLPFSYTYRAFGPEFLAQFGSEWSVWPPEPPVAQPPSPEEAP